MKSKEKTFVIALLALSLFLIIFNRIDRKDVCMVSVKDTNNNVLLTFDINEDYYYELTGKVGLFHIEVKDGKCRAIDVDCPNQICVHTGWISEDYQVPIICLPNGISVQIDEQN